jgi:hypothetical protein
LREYLHALALIGTLNVCGALGDEPASEPPTRRIVSVHFGVPHMSVARVSLALVVLHFAAASAEAAVTQTTYQINPGGIYQVFPSDFGPGIPGGMPSPYQLDFGIGGTFVYELDSVGPTARLLNLNLVLTGNEAIQASEPPGTQVTPEGAEAYLASHTFVEDVIGALLYLESSRHPGLKLIDTLTGGLSVSGGYDSRPVDGGALQLQFSATEIPEPSSMAVVAAAALALRRTRRVRS